MQNIQSWIYTFQAIISLGSEIDTTNTEDGV